MFKLNVKDIVGINSDVKFFSWLFESHAISEFEYGTMSISQRQELFNLYKSKQNN